MPAVAAGAQSGESGLGPDVIGRAVWPSEMDGCSATNAAILVASDVAAQSDVYAAAILAGALGSQCIVDAGGRDEPLPSASLNALRQVGGSLHVVGGERALPQAKVSHIQEQAGMGAVRRISGSSRWSTALLVGEYASQGRISDSDETAITSEAAPSQAGALWPSLMNQCSGAVPVVVAGDRPAQSDVYAAVTLAGAIGSRCLVDAGSRLGPMPFASKTSLAASLHRGFIVGGTASVPLRKIAGYGLSRLSGADRWATARLAGRVAAGDAAASSDAHVFARVAAGPYSNACALRVNGSVACWQGGSRWLTDQNDDRLESAHLSFTPLPVPNLRAIDVAVGSRHACALVRAGDPACWDLYTGERLHDIHESVTKPAFVSIAVTKRERDQAVKEHLCGLTVTGGGRCFPFDNGLKLSFGGRFVAIAFNGGNMCGIGFDSELSCVGPLSVQSSNVAHRSAALISTGANHVCTVDITGSIACRGLSTSGETYFEAFGDYPPPIDQPPAGRFTSIVSGADYACALSDKHQVKCWGTDWHGEVRPPDIQALDIAAADSSACGISRANSVVCWGLNYTTAKSLRSNGAIKKLGNTKTGLLVALQNDIDV